MIDQKPLTMSAEREAACIEPDEFGYLDPRIEDLKKELNAERAAHAETRELLAAEQTQLLNLYSATFPNYAWTDARTALDLFAAEVTTLRYELAETLNERDAARWERDRAISQLAETRELLAQVQEALRIESENNACDECHTCSWEFAEGDGTPANPHRGDMVCGYCKLFSQLAEMREQLEQARKDTERLNWLEQSKVDVECCERIPGITQWEVDNLENSYEIGNTLRDAIDAAMGALRAKQEGGQNG